MGAPVERVVELAGGVRARGRLRRVRPRVPLPHRVAARAGRGSPVGRRPAPPSRPARSPWPPASPPSTRGRPRGDGTCSAARARSCSTRTTPPLAGGPGGPRPLHRGHRPATSRSPVDTGRPLLDAGGGPCLEVLEPGLATTVQDAGRRGVAHLGVPTGGAADGRTAASVHLLLGDEPDTAAAIECTATGPTLRMVGDGHVAVVGRGRRCRRRHRRRSGGTRRRRAPRGRRPGRPRRARRHRPAGLPGRGRGDHHPGPVRVPLLGHPVRPRSRGPAGRRPPRPRGAGRDPRSPPPGPRAPGRSRRPAGGGRSARPGRRPDGQYLGGGDRRRPHRGPALPARRPGRGVRDRPGPRPRW